VLIREDGGQEVVAGLNENGEWFPSFRTLWNLPPNSAIRLEGAGGGGYGNPTERNPELVLKDLIDGYVTRESAFKEYGVVMEPEGTRIDYAATDAERKKRTK
jgi:N-methylhydantoinase B